MPAATVAGPTQRARLWWLLAAQCAVVLACVAVTCVIAVGVQERSIRATTEQRVLEVARTLAERDDVQQDVLLPRAEATARLQPLADVLEQGGGVDYVVVVDAEGVRLAHPTPGERGERVSTDPTDVLAGEVFVGVEEGTLGPTLRAKVPVLVDGEVAGAVSVGILQSRLEASEQEAAGALVPWVAGALAVGFALSAAITAVVGRRMRRLEEGVRELEAQRRVAMALREQTHEFHTRLHAIRGLVADGDGRAALAYVSRLVPVDDDGLDAHVDDAAVRALLEGLAAQARSAGGALEVDPATTVPQGLLGDDDLEVVANLCRNAIESRDGAVARVLVAADETEVVVAVDDDGPGIAREDAARIFERGVSGKPGDRGVGLAIVRRHVRLRGGAVTVGASTLGGARVVVEMPVAAAVLP